MAIKELGKKVTYIIIISINYFRMKTLTWLITTLIYLKYPHQ
jgi:hypothetical protein